MRSPPLCSEVLYSWRALALETFVWMGALERASNPLSGSPSSSQLSVIEAGGLLRKRGEGVFRSVNLLLDCDPERFSTELDASGTEALIQWPQLHRVPESRGPE